MKLDKQTREVLGRLTRSVNDAVKGRASVREAIEELRQIGFEPRFTVRLEPLPDTDQAECDQTDFTEADRVALGRMLIRIR